MHYFFDHIPRELLISDKVLTREMIEAGIYSRSGKLNQDGSPR